MDRVDQSGGRGAEQGVELVSAGALRVQPLHHLDHLIEAGLQHAFFIGPAAHLVEDAFQSFIAGKEPLHGADAGLLVTVTDVEEGVPHLGHARDECAAAHAGIQHRLITVRAAHVHAELVDILAGIALRIDIGDVVAYDINRLVGCIDSEARNRKGSEC